MKNETPKIRARIVRRVSHANNYAGERETVASYNLIAVVDGAPRDVITARIYMGRSRNASTVYASVWIKCRDGEWTSGSGSAGGYGYHKESEALAGAFTSAGVELFGDPYQRDAARNKDRLFFGGTGSSFYVDIFTAIARAAGYRGKCTLITN